jgi:hypothetical protein
MRIFKILRDAVTVAKKRKKKREPAVWIHITGAQKECK